MIRKIVLKPVASMKKEKKNPNINKVAEGLTTPIVTIWKTTLIKPYVYRNGQARFGLVCVVDPSVKEDAEFLKSLEELAVLHNVKSLGTQGKDEKIYIKFAGKEQIKTLMYDASLKSNCEISMEEEFPAGIKGVINYDVNLYFNPKEESWAFNFCPKGFIFHPDKKSKKLLDILDEDGNSTNHRGRPKSKNSRTCES